MLEMLQMLIYRQFWKRMQQVKDLFLLEEAIGSMKLVMFSKKNIMANTKCAQNKYQNN